MRGGGEGDMREGEVDEGKEMSGFDECGRLRTCINVSIYRS